MRKNRYNEHIAVFIVRAHEVYSEEGYLSADVTEKISNVDVQTASVPDGGRKKRIDVVYIKAEDINTNFGNPRKINKKNKDELRRSLETFGDFGCFIVDENNSVIGGNQRLSIIKELYPERELLCKRLVGYSDAEKRAINIKANTHSGDWDMDLLASWTADLNIDFGIKDDDKLEDRELKGMEAIPFEKYDYMLIVCRSELDYNNLLGKFGMDGTEKAKLTVKKSIRARAVWYNDVADRFK